MTDDTQRHDALWERIELGNDAFRDQDFTLATQRYEAVVRDILPSDDALAIPLYENLGFAYAFGGRPKPAMRALLRALDGDLTSREGALRMLIACALQDQRTQEGLAWMRLYHQAFGEHPEGWSLHQIQHSDDLQRRNAAFAMPC